MHYLVIAEENKLDLAHPVTTASPHTTRPKLHSELENAFLVATTDACSSVFASLR